MVARIGMFSGCGKQEAREHDVDGLGDDFLLNAELGAGVELVLIEVGGLIELEELLGLPTQVVQLGYLRAREVRSTQCGEVERLVAVGVGELDSAELDGLDSTLVISGRCNDDAVVITLALAERGDRIECVRGRDPHEEIDVVMEQTPQDFVRRIASVEYEHIARLEYLEVLEQELALAGCVPTDCDVTRCLGHHVDKSAHCCLRDVRTCRPPESNIEVVASLQVHLAAIHREHASVMPARRTGKRALHLRRGFVQDVPKQLRRQLASSLAERGGRHRFLSWQPHAMRSTLIPERVEDVPIASPVSVAGHE